MLQYEPNLMMREKMKLILSVSKGFSLIELMIVVAIISILASIAVPIYTRYIRKSRTSEAISNLGAIAMFEETYFSEGDSYVTTSPNPSEVPGPGSSGDRLPFSETIAGWSTLGRVVPNGSPLYFQYEIRAGRFNSSGGADTGGTGNLQTHTSTVRPGSTGTYPCSPQLSAFSATGSTGVGIPIINNSNWFYATAVGNQKPNGSLRTCSLFIKVIDRPDLYRENETE